MPGGGSLTGQTFYSSPIHRGLSFEQQPFHFLQWKLAQREKVTKSEPEY
jgi:hypothetical protein